MNYKKGNKYIKNIVCYISFMLLLTACKKVETTRTYTVTDTTAQNSIASDEITVNLEFDQAVDDAIKVICNPKAGIVGATVDTSQINLGIIVITYFGYEWDKTKQRTGADSIHLKVAGGHPVWGSPGAVANITFGTLLNPGYEVLYSTNNTSIRLNGTATLTNNDGGYLQNVTAGDSLVEHIRATVSFTYNDQAAMIQYYTWYLNQVRVFTINANDTIVTTRGDTAINNSLNIGTWGTTRLGSSFYTSITTPTIQNISVASLSYNPLSGAKVIEGIAEPITCIYGANSAGMPQLSGAPYGFRIGWVDNGIQATSVLPCYY